jgi:hypothetical protein
MQKTSKIIASILLVITLAFSVGCGRGGTNINLKGLTLGTVTMDGKPISGLPSQKINLLLKVSAREVTVNYDADGTTLILSPSGATLEIKSGGILISGIKPEQVKVEWAVSEQEK